MSILAVDVRHEFESGFRLAAAFATEAPVVGLFGPSGAGKTTMLNLIAGLLRPNDGRVSLNGEALFDSAKRISVPVHRRRIGCVFQEHLLFPHLDVEANLRFGFRAGGGASFEAVATTLELNGLLPRRPHELSGGQRQRVALGRALLTSPRLLLMDEPLASLDDDRRGRILEFLERVLREFPTPLVFVSHSQAEVRRLAQVVVLIDAGEVKAIGPPDEVLSRGPALEYRDELGLTNLLRLDRLESRDGESIGWIGGVELSLPSSPPTLYIKLAPAAVTLAAVDVTGVSARNHLPGTVVAVRDSAGRAFVAVDVGQVLWAEVTSRSVDQMGLSVGAPVVCLVKTQSLQFV